MSKPNSLITQFRRALAAAIEPGPDAGEAWCIDCVLNNGQTTVVSANGSAEHMRAHRETDPPTYFHLQASWPSETEKLPG